MGFLEVLSLGHLSAPPRALLSVSLGWIKSYLLPGLTCSVFQVCSGITAELLTGPCPAPDSCIQLQKSQTGKTCFLAIVQGNCSPETPGAERNEILSVDEWASPTVGLGVTSEEVKGFGYQHFPPNRYVNYFPSREVCWGILSSNHCQGLLRKSPSKVAEGPYRVLPHIC